MVDFLTPREEIDVKVISDLELKRQVDDLTTKALNDLLWYTTTTASQGRFMEKFDPRSKLHLTAWPDISAVGSNKSYLDIAIFMNHNTVDIMTVTEKTQQQLTDVIDFYNGCDVLGLVDKTIDGSFFSELASVRPRQARSLHRSTFKKVELRLVS